jgi:hypothetical protein
MALARLWLCLLMASWTSITTSRAAKITNFTIGAVLNDDRHDTLFREAITVSYYYYILIFTSNTIEFIIFHQELNSDYTLLPVNATLHSASMRLDPNPIRTALKM